MMLKSTPGDNAAKRCWTYVCFECKGAFFNVGKKQQFEEQLGALSSDRNIESLICLEKNTIHNNVNISNAA